MPITGITVAAETLTAGRGCGPGRLAGLQVRGRGLRQEPRTGSAPFDTFVASNVYDCFTDGQFVNLPPSGGETDYALQIYAYNAAELPGAGGDAAVRAAVLNPARSRDQPHVDDDVHRDARSATCSRSRSASRSRWARRGGHRAAAGHGDSRRALVPARRRRHRELRRASTRRFATARRPSAARPAPSPTSAAAI